MHAFKPLVVIVDGEPLASTQTICKGMKAQHASTMKLLRKHQKALERFGRVRFEIQPFETNGGTQSREVALLNEQQAALLISLMRNTPSVVCFKADLIAEFFRMRDALTQRGYDLWKQLQAAIAQEVESKIRASFGSHLMLERKKEKAPLLARIESLNAEIQPGLPLH